MKSIVSCIFAALVATSASALAIDVRFLAWDDAIATRQVAVADGDKVTEIKNLHPLQRTEPIGATPAEGVLMVRALDKKSAEGKPLDLAVKLGGMSKPLVLLLPDAKAPTGLRGFVIEDDSSSFAWGSFRVLNATGKVLNMALGNERKQLPAGWQPVDMKPGGDKPVAVAVLSPEAPKAPLYSGVWKPEPDVRRLVIIVPGTDVRLGPLALKVIPEDRRNLSTASN